MKGISIKPTQQGLTVQRKTNETQVLVELNRDENKKLDIDSGIPFLDHMIETLGWRSKFNIGLDINSEVELKHTIAEDIGITLGRAYLEYYKKQITEGLEGCGYAFGVLDEAFSKVILSIEGRSNSFVTGSVFENVDGISGYDLQAFLEGFSQGCRCTLRVEYNGENPHHCWEAAFRAFGEALSKVFTRNKWRKKSISGLKGTIE